MNDAIKQLEQVITKAMETTSNTATGMGIEYSEDILMKTFQYAPFLQFLEGKGQCLDSKTADVAFFDETPTNSASFIAEGGNVPDFGATTYGVTSDRMKELVETISISDMAQQGTDAVNLLQREIDRAFIDIHNKIDDTLWNGLGTAAAKDFARIHKDIPNANKIDSDGALSEDAIDDMLIQVVDVQGGHPDVLVTDYFTAKQLKAINAPYRRYNDKVEITAGFNVSTYESPDGSELPILIDKNIPTADSGAKHNLYAIDSSAIEVKYLMRPTMKEVASMNNSRNVTITSFVTARNIAPYMCGVVENIVASS